MKGQWIGFTKSGSTNSGFIILNFITSKPAEAHVVFSDFDPSKPNVAAKLSITVSGNQFEGRLFQFEEWDSALHKRIQGKELGDSPLRSGSVTGRFSGNRITGKWNTNIDTGGSFELINRFYMMDDSRADEHRPYVNAVDWEGLKLQLDSQRPNAGKIVIYRGQGRPWPLRTSYCRAGGTCLRNYIKDYLSDVARHVNSSSNYKYFLKKDDDIGALMNLAQHHSYPTPILDWTESPYVAAFFAFEGVGKERKSTDKVSIFQMSLTKESVSDEFSKWMLEAPIPIIKIGRFPTFDNNRALPQQAVGLYANIDDIEEMIQLQGIAGKISMARWDIPVSERDKVMTDLRKMGITAASMFPGLDGICRSLKEQHFY